MLVDIIAGGFIVGFGYWVLDTTAGPTPLIYNTVMPIPCYIFLSGIAGFLGVFLVAKNEPEPHAYVAAFAVVCELFWVSVISGAKAIVSIPEAHEGVKKVRRSPLCTAEVNRKIDATHRMTH